MGNFYTEVIRTDPRFDSTDQIRDTALLEPNTRRKVAAIISDAAANGHTLIVLETYRSQARQEQLFNERKTQLQTVGMHHFGIACDLGFLKPDGSVNWNADYSVLRDFAKDHEMISGFDWGKPELHHGFVDPDHIQYVSVADQNSVMDGSWYPPEDGSYNPFEHL